MSRKHLRAVLRKCGVATATILGLTTLAAQAGANCAPQDTLFAPCQGDVKVELLVLPNDVVPAPAQRRRITVTGTYSSGDRFGIEGLAIKNGMTASKRFQKWDGGLLIDAAGHAQIVNVAAVPLGLKTFNLKDKTDRPEFLSEASTQKISFIQSHLLITDGNLDTREVAGAPRFQRRILYSDKAGNISLFDSGNRALTLFEAASELHKTHNAHMALNLDMGSYDYCQIENGTSSVACGIIRSASDTRLTNLLQFTIY